jgi:hypothetical protein
MEKPVIHHRRDIEKIGLMRSPIGFKLRFFSGKQSDARQAHFGETDTRRNWVIEP